MPMTIAAGTLPREGREGSVAPGLGTAPPIPARMPSPRRSIMLPRSVLFLAAASFLGLAACTGADYAGDAEEAALPEPAPQQAKAAGDPVGLRGKSEEKPELAHAMTETG